MAFTCRFFEQNNIDNFFQSERYTFVFFTKQKQFFFLQKRLLMLREIKLQIVTKMKQRSFFAGALPIVLLSYKLQKTMVKKCLIKVNYDVFGVCEESFKV